MSDELERSNLVIAKILDAAMKNGIKHWSLEFFDLNLDEGYATNFYPCIEWLESEGLIRIGATRRLLGGIADGTVHNIALTSRGMAVLGQTIDVAGNSLKLSEAVTKVSNGQLSYNKIGDAIGGIIAGFVKAIGN